VILQSRPRVLAVAHNAGRHAARAGGRNGGLLIAALGACEVAGLTAIAAAYLIAQTTAGDEAEFIWFWLGMIAVELPVIAVVARRGGSAAGRSAVLVVFGFVSYAPKLLRDPSGPAYHDEFAHWRDTYDIVASGRLFQNAQIIPIIARYPGLHAVTAVLVDVTGLDIWQAATVLLLLCHVALLLGIAVLARAAGLGSRAAALAAAAYGFNASFLYFDTQFAYESMAITLVVWALAAFAQALRARPGPHRRAWCGLTVLLASGCVITHHLSTIELTVVMAGVSIAISLPGLARSDGWKSAAATAWGLTAFTGLSITAWIVFVAPATAAYLSPYLGAGLSQLLHLAAGTGAGRQLFSASLSPWWEHDAAFAVTVIALGLAAGSLLMLRRWLRQRALPSGRGRALLVAYTALGLIYFPSTAFILSPAGAEGARRSWAISWIGLAVAVGPMVAWLLDWAARRSRLGMRAAARAGLAVVAAVALVGGTAAGLDASYRLPGPYLFGSDARSDTPELDAMTRWFLDRFGPGNNVVTDRYTGLLIASYGLQDTALPSAGFPVWDLYSDQPGQPIGPPSLITELTSADFRYLIVDERMADDAPQLGVYFEGTEPTGLIRPDGQPVFKGRLGKFGAISWMTKVFQSDNYAVYRMSLPASGDRYQASPVRLGGKLTVRQ
jgi:hypothetical protein